MAPLNYINYLNVAAACVIAFHTIDIDLGPEYDFFDKFNLREFPRRYEEGSFTPAEPFFLMFNVGALFLMVFAIVQLLPAYSSSPMVQDGVQYWFFIGTIAQFLAYVLSDEARESFAKRFFSTLLYGVAVGSIWKILDNQASARAVSDNSPEEFWLLRFPFSLQAGWIIALVIMSANVLFIGDGGGNDDEGGFNFSPFMHGFIVLVSLIVYAGLSVKLLLFNKGGPNYVIPAVFSLVTYGIAINTDDREEATWKSVTLLILIYLISVGSAVGTAFLIYINEYKAKASDALDPLSENSYQGEEMASTEPDKVSDDTSMV